VGVVHLSSALTKLFQRNFQNMQLFTKIQPVKYKCYTVLPKIDELEIQSVCLGMGQKTSVCIVSYVYIVP